MGSGNGWMVAALAAAVAGLGVGGPSAALARTDVPIRQVAMPDGTIRYAVAVTIGDGTPVDAELDTGSFGLRILTAAVKPDAYAATSIRRTYAFSGGAQFEGFLARASVGIGSSRTEAPLYVMVIDHVSCVESKPHCYAARVKPEEYGIAGGGVPNQGFKAILGISMRQAATGDSAVNPLAVMGDGRWILSLPRPGSPDPGHLIIDPDPSEQADFAPLQLKPEAGSLSGWADAALPGCLVGQDGRRLCGDTLVDSGAPGVSVGTSDVSEPRPYGAGKPVTLEIGGEGGPVSIPFVTGRDIASRVFLHPLKDEGTARISAGTLPYLSYDVLYDVKRGTMGFRRREPQTP